MHHKTKIPTTAVAGILSLQLENFNLCLHRIMKSFRHYFSVFNLIENVLMQHPCATANIIRSQAPCGLITLFYSLN